MKKITKECLPEILTDDILEILIDMALEFPKTTLDWQEVSKLLEERGQLMLVLAKVDERKKNIEKAKRNFKTSEEKIIKEQHRKNFYETIDPSGFYGNMGEPETIQQYKDKYGIWPPGYDINGNKI